jgi:hypothetical protein
MSDDYNEDELEAILNEEDSEDEHDSISDIDPRDIESSLNFDDKKKPGANKYKRNSSNTA